MLTVPPLGSGTGLHVLLVRPRDPRHGLWSLPGPFLHDGETLAQAVLRSLRTKACIDGLHPRQLHVFDTPGRDDRGWVLSVAHVDLVPWGQLEHVATRDDVRLAPHEEIGPLPFDHAEIVARGVRRARQDYEGAPDPAGLLPEPFTLRQLEQLHEAVSGTPLPRDTFRRRMEPALSPRE